MGKGSSDVCFFELMNALTFGELGLDVLLLSFHSPDAVHSAFSITYSLPCSYCYR